jgi:hypothetical protein
MNSAESFSATYAEARASFRQTAEAAGGALERFPNPNRGPDGGDLSTDVAWFGPQSAERVLVMVSGTHGVEGFCGSGAQVDWLRRGEQAALPAGTAALLVHAINPYGFAWLRRVTEENIDLNRNWIDFAGGAPANPGYDELADAAVPEAWTAESQIASGRVLRAYGEAHGAMALQQALSGGQYNHDTGVFYGGAGQAGRGGRRRRSTRPTSARPATSPSSTTTPVSDPGAMPSRSCPTPPAVPASAAARPGTAATSPPRSTAPRPRR